MTALKQLLVILMTLLRDFPKKDVLLTRGDSNAKVGSQETP